MKQRACTTVHHGFHGACMYLRWVCNKIKRSLGTSNSYILPACFKSSGTCAKASGLTCKKQDPSDPFTTFVMLCCILLHDVACNREPRLLAVENLDAPAARMPCVGDQSVSTCDGPSNPLRAKCTTQEASASPRSPTAANMKFRSLRSAWTVSNESIQHKEREFKTDLK